MIVTRARYLLYGPIPCGNTYYPYLTHKKKDSKFPTTNKKEEERFLKHRVYSLLKLLTKKKGTTVHLKLPLYIKFFKYFCILGKIIVHSSNYCRTHIKQWWLHESMTTAVAKNSDIANHSILWRRSHHVAKFLVWGLGIYTCKM